MDNIMKCFCGNNFFCDNCKTEDIYPAWIPFRKSITDLATDIVFTLNDKQLSQFLEQIRIKMLEKNIQYFDKYNTHER